MRKVYIDIQFSYKDFASGYVAAEYDTWLCFKVGLSTILWKSLLKPSRHFLL